MIHVLFLFMCCVVQRSHSITGTSYGPVSKYLYIVYRSMPFVFEIRSVLDWAATETSLDLFMWLKLEDIYASLFKAKCEMVRSSL